METMLDDLNVGRWIGLVFTGIFVGYMGGYCGIGGAPFMVAFLLLIVDVCQHLAQGTVLAVMLPPMSLMAVVAMWDRCKVLWKITVPAFCGYAVMSYAGAELAFLMDNEQLGYFFGGFLILLGLRYGKQYALFQLAKRRRSSSLDSATRTELAAVAATSPKDGGESNVAETYREGSDDDKNDHDVEASDVPDLTLDIPKHVSGLNPNGPTIADGALLPFNNWTALALGSIIGVVGGLFGIGAGVLMVPVMTEIYGVHKDDARTLSLLILLPPVSAGAIVKYEGEDSVDWPAAGLLFVLYFLSNYSGAMAGRRAKSASFKMVMGMCLCVLGIISICIKATAGDDKNEAC